MTLQADDVVRCAWLSIVRPGGTALSGIAKCPMRDRALCRIIDRRLTACPRDSRGNAPTPTGSSSAVAAVSAIGPGTAPSTEAADPTVQA